MPKAGIQLTSWLNWNRSPCGANCVAITIVSANVSNEKPRATCLTRLTPAAGIAATTTAPASGTAPMTVSQGNVMSAPHQKESGQDEDDAAEHRQCVRPDEAGLETPEPARCTADECGEAVHEAVDAAVVEVDKQPREVLAGPHEHRLVEGVAEQVTTSSNSQRTASGSNGRDGTTGVEQPRPDDTEDDDAGRGKTDHADGLEVDVSWARHNDGEELREPAAENQRVAAADGTDRKNPHRNRHDARRFVRVHAFCPPLVAEERHDHDERHVERGQACGRECAAAKDRT